MKDTIIITATAALTAGLLTLLFGFVLLPVLRAKKAGQPISVYAPTAHQAKAGTPTMGGISFVPAFLVVMAVAVVVSAARDAGLQLIPLALIAMYALGNAAIGFIDDYFKLNRRQNEGLTERQKLVLQVVIAAAFIAMLRITGNLSTALHIPFFNVWWELSWFAYPLYLLVLVGFVNATNLHDLQ